MKIKKFTQKKGPRKKKKKQEVGPSAVDGDCCGIREKFPTVISLAENESKVVDKEKLRNHVRGEFDPL